MNRRIINLTLLIFALSICICAQKPNRAASASTPAFNNLSNDLVPAFAYTYLSVWEPASTEFALYQDGTVIYRKCTEKDNPYTCFYLTAQLSPEEAAQIMKKINPDRFSSYDERYTPDYSAGYSSDLPQRRLVLRQTDGTYKKVLLTGGFRGKEYQKGFSVENVPPDLGETIDFVTNFDTPKALDWQAEYYEVAIEPSTDKSEKTVKWLKSLPDLTDAKTIKHKEYDRYSLFIARSQRAEFFKVWWKYNRKSSDERAVIINNQKWDLKVRIPFPSESVWLGDFRN